MRFRLLPDVVAQIPGRLPVRARRAALAVLAVAGIAALGGKCIDRTNVYVDKDGYTHIVGEMNNDTNVQGVRIMLRGTLYDAQDNVIATKDAPTCPPDTQPNTSTLFDIRFDNPNVPPYARFDVRPVDGRALEQPLPNPDVVTLSTDAVRFQGLPPIPGLGITDQDVFVEFGVRNRGAPLQGVQGCAAVYGQTGAVIYATADELVQVDQNNVPHPATLNSTNPASVFFVAKNVPTGPTQIRMWLWFGSKGAPTSQYQYVQTPLITIQTVNAP